MNLLPSFRRAVCFFITCALLVSIPVASGQTAVNDTRSQAFGLFDAGYVPANNSGASAEPGEPTHGGVGTGHSLWWQWQGGTGAHTLTLRPYRPGLSFVLVVYSVDSEGQLTQQASVQAQSMTPQSVRFDAEPGVDYLLAVDSASVGTGWFYFSIDQAPEIHAPLSLSYKQGEQISIPIQIAGFPDSVELLGGDEFFSYDPFGQRIIGSVRPDVTEERVTIRASNEFGQHEVWVTLFQNDSDYALTSPASALGFVGVPFEYVLDFAGAPGFRPQSLDFNQLPNGLAGIYEQGQWKIKGVPQHPNTEWISINYDNADGSSSAEVSLEFIDYNEAGLVPEITSPLMAYATVGVPFNYQIETSLPVEEFNTNGLPQGLSLNQNTGLISGTPTNESYGDIYVQAFYGGRQVEGMLKLVFIEEPVVQFLVPPILYAYEGVPFQYAITTSSSAQDFEVFGLLPQGLSLNRDTGVITGTPTQQGEFDFRLMARNLYGFISGSRMRLTIKVLDAQPLLRVTSPAQVSGTRREYFEYQLESAPLPNDAFNVNILSLPTGLSYNETTHKIVGVPQNDGLQSASLRLENNEFELQFQIGNSVALPEFLSPASAVAKSDNFFFFAFSAPGANSFQIVGGSLPDGLNFNTSSGVITGAPTTEGDFNLVVRAHQNGTYSDTSFALFVRENPDASEPLILSPGHMTGAVGEMVVYQIGSNVSSSTTYNVIGLPSGFQFDSSSGIIYGSVSNPLEQSFLVQHGLAEAEVLLNVYPPEPNSTPLLVVSPPSALGEPGQAFYFQIETNAATIGAQIDEFVPDSSWPDGLMLDRDTGRVSGYLGEDWPPQLGYNIYSSEGNTESFLSIVDASAGRPPVIESAGHITAYEGDYIEYIFDLANPTTELQILDNGTNLTYDPVQQKLFGNLDQISPFGIDVEFGLVDPDNSNLSSTGTVRFQVFDPWLRPEPIVTSQLSPVAEVGQRFVYQFDLNQADATLGWMDTGEQWLKQTGPREISGIVPESGTGPELRVRFDYENPYSGHNNAELWIQIAEPIRPTVVTSPAAATAFVGVPFSYQLSVEPTRVNDTVEALSLPAWLSVNEATRILSGVPDSAGSDMIDIRIHTESGSYDSTISILASNRPQRPMVIGFSPAPGFLNVPFVLPFSIKGIYDQFDFDISPDYSINATNTALVGVPMADQGGQNGEFQISNANEPGYVQFEISYFESAPVIIEHPRSMVSFEGGKAYFSAQYGGRDYSAAWLKDGSFYLSGQPQIEFEDLELADQGDYSVRIANPIGEAVSQPARLTVGTPKKLRDWTIAHVGQLIEIQPGGESSESWANDGVSNLMKWAMGLPLEATHTEPLIGGKYAEGALQLEFMRNTNAEDVTLLVERSETLAADSWQPIARRLAGGSWQSLRPSAAVTESGTGEVRTVRVRDTSTSDRGFLRVSVLLEP